VVPLGHQLTFKDALHTVTQDLTLKFLVPRWAMGLTKRLRHARLAFDELHVCTIIVAEHLTFLMTLFCSNTLQK
jgi:hypothetical protein